MTRMRRKVMKTPPTAHIEGVTSAKINGFDDRQRIGNIAHVDRLREVWRLQGEFEEAKFQYVSEYIEILRKGMNSFLESFVSQNVFVDGYRITMDGF